MPMFLSDEEFARFSHDPMAVELAEIADTFIKGVYEFVNTKRIMSNKAIKSLRSEVKTWKGEYEKEKRFAKCSEMNFANGVQETRRLRSEVQALKKQLKEARQETPADTAKRHTLIHTRLQNMAIMREALRAERAKRKAITESFDNAAEQRSKLLDELEKHKQAVKAATDESEKLKNDQGNELQGTSAVELPPGTLLEDLTRSYLGAVENFERAAHPICDELSEANSSGVNFISSGVMITNKFGVRCAPSVLDVKTLEEEKQSSLAQPKVEVPKLARKLVPHGIVISEEPQGDTEMSEAHGSNNGKQVAPSQEPQVNTILVASLKLPSTSLTSESQELLAEETSSEIGVPFPKKAKGSKASPVDDMVDAADQCMKDSSWLF